MPEKITETEEFGRWFRLVALIANAAGVALSTEYEQTFVYLYLKEETPGNAVKRYVDTRVRMFCIQNDIE